MIPFVKMCGSGNDFVVIDNRALNMEITPSWVRGVCCRKFGVGADGILVVETSKKASFKLRIFNCDGSEAEMCGNGARCVARYAYLQGIVGNKMQFETLAGLIEAEIINQKVRVKLIPPKDVKLNIKINGYCVHFVKIGVPHTILFVDQIDKLDVIGLGRELRFHRYFSTGFSERLQGTNVNFVELVSNSRVKVRTYERGVENETLACGTGSAASVCIAALLRRVNSPVEVVTKGGKTITVYFEKDGTEIKNLYIEGDADITFEGKLLFR